MEIQRELERIQPSSHALFDLLGEVRRGAGCRQKDVLEALSIGAGPKRVLISLGYSAWGEGQLESELAENSWLTVGADTAVIFDTPVEQRYDRAMKLLGLEPWMLSNDVGHS